MRNLVDFIFVGYSRLHFQRLLIVGNPQTLLNVLGWDEVVDVQCEDVVIFEDEVISMF